MQPNALVISLLALALGCLPGRGGLHRDHREDYQRRRHLGPHPRVRPRPALAGDAGTAGRAMQVALPDGRTGMKSETEVCPPRRSGLHQIVVADGFNERGLSIGIFYFPGYALYAKLTPENAPTGLLSVNLWAGSWVTSPPYRK